MKNNLPVDIEPIAERKYMKFEEARVDIGYPKSLSTFRRKLKEAERVLGRPIPPEPGYLLASQVAELNDIFIELAGVKRGLK